MDVALAGARLLPARRLWRTNSGDPAPRRCDTPENVCGRTPVEPVLFTDHRGLHQSDGHKPTWIFVCECGWRRWELAR